MCHLVQSPSPETPSDATASSTDETESRKQLLLLHFRTSSLRCLGEQPGVVKESRMPWSHHQGVAQPPYLRFWCHPLFRHLSWGTGHGTHGAWRSGGIELPKASAWAPNAIHNVLASFNSVAHKPHRQNSPYFHCSKWRFPYLCSGEKSISMFIQQFWG